MHALKIAALIIGGVWAYLFFGAMLAWYWHVEYENLDADISRVVTMIFWPIAPILEIITRS